MPPLRLLARNLGGLAFSRKKALSPAVSPEKHRPTRKQSSATVQKKSLWVKKLQKIFVGSFCREFNMPSGFHHLTAVDICQPTLQLKLQIEAEKVLYSSDDEFFHKNKSMKKKILHKTGQVISLTKLSRCLYVSSICAHLLPNASLSRAR